MTALTLIATHEARADDTRPGQVLCSVMDVTSTHMVSGWMTPTQCQKFKSDVAAARNRAFDECRQAGRVLNTISGHCIKQQDMAQDTEGAMFCEHLRIVAGTLYGLRASLGERAAVSAMLNNEALFASRSSYAASQEDIVEMANFLYSPEGRRLPKEAFVSRVFAACDRHETETLE